MVSDVAARRAEGGNSGEAAPEAGSAVCELLLLLLPWYDKVCDAEHMPRISPPPPSPGPSISIATLIDAFVLNQYIQMKVIYVSTT